MRSSIALQTTYGFEDISPDLARPPLAAQRALGVAGVRLPPALWTQLSVEAREAIALAGLDDAVNVGNVLALLKGLPFGKFQIGHPVAEPDATNVPRDLATVLGPWLAAVRAGWSHLTSIDRHVLTVLTPNPRLLWRALAEIAQRNRWRGSAGLPAIDGLLARSELRLGRAARESLQDPRFHDGRAGVLARASGVRAARRVADLLDVQAEASIGPVELEWCAPRADAVVWQAHVSTVEGKFSVAGSLIAASTAAIALLDLLLEVDPAASIVETCIADEPWLGGGSQEESTLAR